jgi:hypothetical protein
MRKNLALAVLTLLAVASLSLAQTGAASKSHSKKAGGNSLDQMIIGKSRETWEAYKNRNIAAVRTLTGEDYVSYAMSGSSNLQQDIADLNSKKLAIESYTIDDSKVSMAAKDTAIHRYKCSVKGSFDGKPFSNPVYVTEVWVKRGGRWQIVSYQETPVS